jgi:hypothetical protein
MRTLTGILGGLLFILGGLSIERLNAASGDQRRYVVPSKLLGNLITEYPLWRDGRSLETCVQANRRGTPRDKQIACEEGFPGLPKPQVGVVKVGDEVELLDSRECGKLSYIRVLTGQLKAETGCVATNALSSVKP